MNDYLFFDSASTTKCCEGAAELLQRYAQVDYGNPSSIHAIGRSPARAIRDAREFFASFFGVEPEQVVFTGSGTEANNLAVLGTVLPIFLRHPSKPEVLCSAIEHPSVNKTVHSLKAWGIQTAEIPVDSSGQVLLESYLQLITEATALITVQQVNNILGSILPVEDLARQAKERNPKVLFHTDAVQAFGKVRSLARNSIDLLSISAHKINGPKGVGALIVLNKKLLTNLRPMIWGGEQESGLRSGTQNAGLIAGFHFAAAEMIKNRDHRIEKVKNLQAYFKKCLFESSLKDKVRWNSPTEAVPHIIHLGIPGVSASTLANLLEDKGCIVSVSSACRSKKSDPDPVLKALGLPLEVQDSSFRVSLCDSITTDEIDRFIQALQASVESVQQLSHLTQVKR